MQLINANALRFKNVLELAEAVAEKPGGVVAAGMKRRGHHAVFHVNGHLQRAQLRRIEADVHRPAAWD